MTYIKPSTIWSLCRMTTAGPYILHFFMQEMALDATDMGVAHPACRNIRLVS